MLYKEKKIVPIAVLFFSILLSSFVTLSSIVKPFGAIFSMLAVKENLVGNGNT